MAVIFYPKCDAKYRLLHNLKKMVKEFEIEEEEGHQKEIS